MWCFAWQPYFLKIMFCPQNGENRPSPGFFECIGKFSFFSQFFTFLSIWSIMKVYITVILVCLNKFHIWENSGSWDMAQNSLGQSGLRDFSINCRTLKLAVSHKEVNEINLFLVCPSNSFPSNGSLDFSDFWHSGRQIEYWKTDESFFPEKFIFGPNLGKNYLAEWLQKRVFLVFWKFWSC